MLLFGKEARSYLTPDLPAAEVVKLRKVLSIDLRVVEYHRDWLWRMRASGWRGCLGVLRTRTGSSAAFDV